MSPPGCEPDEYFIVSLLPRTLTATGTSCAIGAHQTTRVAIIDDDEKPGGRANELKFASLEYSVMENEGIQKRFTLTVNVVQPGRGLAFPLFHWQQRAKTIRSFS